jgi:16S rRNA (uracil1498-N3)-methyltransferase
MSKHRFFVSSQQVKDGLIFIKSGPDVNHIKNVLRLKGGDELVVCDGTDFEYEAKIDELSSSEVKVMISKKRKIKQIFPQVTLIQAVSKGLKMDMIVRQATELGAFAVIPVTASRTVVKLDKEKKKKKQERWQKIAKEAAEQSQRSTIPQIFPVLLWDGLLNMISSFDLALVFWEEAKERFSRDIFNSAKLDKIGVIIGPEGGFSKDEIEDLKKLGVCCVSLGKHILRTETASIVALGIVLYELEKLGGKRV